MKQNFYREDIFTGRGRLIAGDLTDELRRLYEPSKKFGEANPLLYSVLVCPHCFYAAYPQDFSTVADRMRDELRADTDRRKNSIGLLFTDLDYTIPRTLKEGAAFFYFAVMSYDHFHKDYSPTFKRGLSALRCAWLMSDLHRKYPGENFDYVARIFYHKARFFYCRAVELEQNGEESLGAVHHYGPDLDKNYGYDGLLYISGFLEYRYGLSENPERRREALENAKRTVSRIFGMGKASKDKPSAILEKSRDLFSLIGSELKDDSDDDT